MAGTLFTADLGDIGATQVPDYSGPSTGLALGGLLVSALKGGAEAYADSKRRQGAGGLTANQQLGVEENERFKQYVTEAADLKAARDGGNITPAMFNAKQAQLATRVATNDPKLFGGFTEIVANTTGFDMGEQTQVQLDRDQIVDRNIVDMMEGDEGQRALVASWAHATSNIQDPDVRQAEMRNLYMGHQSHAMKMDALAKKRVTDPNAQTAMDGELRTYTTGIFNSMIADGFLTNPDRMKEIAETGAGYKVIEGMNSVRILLSEQVMREAEEGGYTVSEDKLAEIMKPIDNRIEFFSGVLGSNQKESLERMGADQRLMLANMLKSEGLFAGETVGSVVKTAGEHVTTATLSGPDGERLSKILAEGRLEKYLPVIDMGALNDIDGTAKAIRFAFDEIGFNDAFVLVKTGLSSAENAAQVAGASAQAAQVAGEKANAAATTVTAFLEESPLTVASPDDVDALASLTKGLMDKPTDKLSRPELEAKERILANWSARTVAAGERLDQQIDSMQGTRLEGTFVKGTVNNKGRADLVVSPTSAVGKLLEAQGLPLFASSIEKLAPEARGRFGEPPADVTTVGVTNMAKSMYDGQIKPLVGTYGRFQQYNNKWAGAAQGEPKKSGTEPLSASSVSNIDSVQGSNVADTTSEGVELPSAISPQLVSSPNVDAMVEDILVREGGFVNDPDDPGGATNFGITIGTAIENNLDKDGNGVVDVKDVQLITKEDAAKIFKEKYFVKPQIDKLPPELHANVFDMNINAGANSIRILQRLVGVDDDGVIGPETIAAVQKAAEAQGADQLNIAYAKARRDYYAEITRNNPKLKKFLVAKSGGKGGWIKRAEEFLPEGERLSADGWKEFKASV